MKKKHTVTDISFDAIMPFAVPQFPVMTHA